MKLAHLADLHLGFRQFDRQTPRGTNQREADVAEAFRRAVDDIIQQRPDLILIAGDIFHSVRPTNAAILFCFQQLQRLRTGLANAPIVAIAGEHDTPRSVETGTILRLYEALGVAIAVDVPRRLLFPELDCAVLAVPHQALAQAERPALRPEPGGPTLNVLLAHGDNGGLGEERGTLEYGGAILSRETLAAEKWDYIALGHYHTAHAVAANAWYSGSLEYLPPNPWGQLQDETEQRATKKGRKNGGTGKGYLLVDLPGARVTFRPIAPTRRHLDLEPIQGAGLNAKELDALIAQRLSAVKIDDQIVRLLVWDVDRAVARDLDHAAIRAYKARALNLHLDLRRPQRARVPGVGGPGARRQTLGETLSDFLSRRPLDAELNRNTFVKLGVEYLEAVARADGEGTAP
jgi:DNA repair exonuclease SbcCD nuclease subunit